jgi:phage terminase small subunit
MSEKFFFSAKRHSGKTVRMTHRGRKSKAERAMLALVRPDPTDKPAPPTLDPLSPPAHLSPAMKAWWQQVLGDYKHQPHELFVLKMACQAFDEAETARKFLEKKGRTYADDHGVARKRPEVSIEQNARGFFLRAVRQLGLLRATEQIKDRNRTAIGVSWQQLQEQQHRWD